MESTSVCTLHSSVKNIGVNRELPNSVTRADIMVLRGMRCTGPTPPRGWDVKTSFTKTVMAVTRHDRDQQRNGIPGSGDISRKVHPPRKSKTTGRLPAFWARRLEKWAEVE